ncbi:MAG: hypothetical protein H7256_02075 [Bdellovibrio sp.]|nr:hypothetical protein [Bdellovibrio sp.]
MKHLLIAASFIFSLTTFAQTAAPVLPASLGKTMKAMSTNLKAIVAQATEATKNESSAKLADDFVTLTLHAKDFAVDSIQALPAEQQAAAKAEYDKMLEQTAITGQQLAAAFRANDNVLAANLLKQLSQDKKDGHDKFKKD